MTVVFPAALDLKRAARLTAELDLAVGMPYRFGCGKSFATAPSALVSFASLVFLATSATTDYSCVRTDLSEALNHLMPSQPEVPRGALYI